MLVPGKTPGRSANEEPCQVRGVKKRAPNCGRIQHDHPVIYTLPEGPNSLLVLCVCFIRRYHILSSLCRTTLVRYRRRPFLPPPSFSAVHNSQRQQTKK